VTLNDASPTCIMVLKCAHCEQMLNGETCLGPQCKMLGPINSGTAANALQLSRQKSRLSMINNFHTNLACDLALELFYPSDLICIYNYRVGQKNALLLETSSRPMLHWWIIKA